MRAHDPPPSPWLRRRACSNPQRLYQTSHPLGGPRRGLTTTATAQCDHRRWGVIMKTATA
ncbi:hypothetical protein [Kibdelosporangium philippinense]|uniref:hypothetical protein n=1 Tax=Kibdelosporangium philippinense TaxID=211113 RepID=UPI0036061C1F